MVVPEAALRLVYGQMADEAILASAHVLPGVLQASGFQFEYPALEPALEHLLQAQG
jgi:NAD dependent epimerase/dehydratase family enzyme